MGDMRVAPILDPCHLLPRSFVNRVLLKRRSRVLCDSRESCAWSCGALSRPLRGGTNVGLESSLSCWEVRPLCSTSGSVGFVLVGTHRALISKDFGDQAEGGGTFVYPVPAEAHWHLRQVDNHARFLRMMGNRTMEDLDSDEAEFQQILAELTDAKNNFCTTMDSYRDTGCLGHLLVFLATFLRTARICHS